MKKILPIILALILILVSVTILVDLIGWLQTDTILGQYWPVVFILLGVVSISPNNASANGFSFGMAALGTLLLLRNLGVFNTPVGQTVLVVLLALFALVVLVLALSPKKNTDDKSNRS